MGKSPVDKRLVIWCLDEQSYDDWKDLEEKGHQVIKMNDLAVFKSEHPSIIVGEAAHYWVKGMSKYRDKCLKDGRIRKKEGK